MLRMPNLRFSLCLLLAVLIGLTPITPRTTAAPQDRSQTGGDRGGLDPKLDLKNEDPCSLVANFPVLSNLENLCRAGGTSVGVAKGDFNGDGYADLAIGEPGATISGQSQAGDVIILYGSANGVQTTAPHWQLWYEGRAPIIPSVGTGDHFGSALASGDFNGDGYSDLAIGIPGRTISTSGFFGPTSHPGAGAVLILYGSANGLATSNEQYFDLNWIAAEAKNFNTIVWDQGAFDNAHFGQALAWGVFQCAPTCDFTDGLAIGIPDIRGLNTGVSQAGAVYMLWGGGSLLFDHDDAPAIYTEDGDFQVNDLLGEQAGARFGAAIAAVDEGNGHSDLAIGAPGRTTGILVNGSCAQNCLPGAGVVDLLRAPEAHGTGGIVVSDAGTANQNEHFGSAIAAGNFTGTAPGKGAFQIAIGIPGRTIAGQANAGAVAVVAATGSEVQLLTASSVGGTSQTGDQFGAALAANDFNSDGHADLAIGIPFKAAAVNRNGSAVSLAGAGEVDVLYGSSTGLATPAQRWNQETALGAGAAQAGAHFGASLSAWNYGRNQALFFQGVITTIVTADLAIGAPDRTINGLAGAGQVTVLYGSAPGGLTNASPGNFNSDNIGIGSQANAHFGTAVY